MCLFARQICVGNNVFPVVTGLINSASEKSTGDASTFSFRSIYLQPLQIKHSVNILNDLFGTTEVFDVVSLPPQLRNTLTRTTGIPRQLEDLKFIVSNEASKFIENDIVNLELLKNELLNLTLAQSYKIITNIKPPLFPDSKIRDTCCALVALCLTQTRVSKDTELSKSENNLVIHAVNMQLCYLLKCKVDSDKFTIWIPPVFLQSIMSKCRDNFCSIPIVADMSSPLDSRGNETLLISRIIYKCYALKLVHPETKKVKLSELLGMDNLPPNFKDVEVDIDIGENYRRHSANIETAKGIIESGTGAHINGLVASYSDAWIKFKCGFILFIQEKLQVLAKVGLVNNHANAQLVHQSKVAKDSYTKIFDSFSGIDPGLNESNHLYLFLDDGRDRKDSYNTKNALTLASDGHRQILGNYLAEMRLISTRTTSVDFYSDDSTIIGAKRPWHDTY